jgi:hypothetical protein
LFGKHGSVTTADTFNTANLPLVYAAPSARGVSLSKVDISQTQTSDGTVVTIQAASADGNEIDELLVCTFGRVIAGTRCDCPGNQFWADNQCKTPYVPPRRIGIHVVVEQGPHQQLPQ